VPNPPGRTTGGQVLFHDDGGPRDLLALSEQEARAIRGDKISMIFQDPMTSLNPVLSVGYQIAEPLKIHRGMSENAARKRAVELLEEVGIPAARSRINSFPHEFSGGMRQRVMIAM